MSKLPAASIALGAALCGLLLSPAPGFSAQFGGVVANAAGAPIGGAMVTFMHGSPSHETTVFSEPDGRYATPELTGTGPWKIRARHIGWKDVYLFDHPDPSTAGRQALDIAMEPETDPAAVAAQLPANRWYALLLESVDDRAHREELVRQCTYCHQQGNWATRMQRSEEEWQKVLALMGRMGGTLSSELRARVPELFNEAYALDAAIPRLTAGMDEPGFVPELAAAVTHASVEEWVLGHPASMQHDLAVHPSGDIYSVDMTQDKLYRLDPSVPGGRSEAFDVPHGDLPLGGVFGSAGGPMPPNANAYVGPHSIQIAPDGAIWTTLALGNQLARFDPKTSEWEIHELQEGFYPHTLRFDQKGRVWYTIAVSNHIGVYDPASEEHRWIRLPAPTWQQDLTLRMLPFFMWLSKHVDLSGAADSGEGINAPVPYGIDVAPNGDIWFSQLNAHRIGRIDPETFEVEMLETPFSAPRRLRFDSRGKLWIPGFSSGLIARFDPETREFESWPLPIEPLGSETPYALNVDRRSDTVWICGTNSDSLIRFEPESELFTVFPLPTRVTYTREIDFDEQGRVWTSNSNLPAWQIEGGQPRVLRLDPHALRPVQTMIGMTGSE